MSVYEPGEDSDLLEREVIKHAKGVVLDVGTGSGVQAIAAMQNKNVEYAVAVDINEDALELAAKNCSKKSIKNIYFFVSDLFSLFDFYSVDAKGKLTDNKNSKKGLMKFDTIIFNPPYLPQEKKERDIALEGGKKGYEVIAKFLERLSDFMADDGICLLVFSSHSKKDVIESVMQQQLFDFEIVANEKMFFEEMFVYKIKKSETLIEIGGKGFTHLKYFAHGKRGIIHTADFKMKGKGQLKVAIKSKKKESEAINRIENEAKWLKLLNKKDIGPKLVLVDELFFAYEFIDGDFFPDFLVKANKKDAISAVHKVLQQCYQLDLLKVDKEEMHHPIKHVLVKKEDGLVMPYLLDFERANSSPKPKNVTQFSVYLVGDFILSTLKAKGIEVDRQKVLDAARDYKHEMNKKNFDKILEMFS